MKKILASLLLISSMMFSTNLNSINQEKPKHRYGEKILVFINQ